MEKLPGQGFVFWPVGCGDSTTVIAARGVVLQVDLREREAEDTGSAPLIDQLVALLPKVDDRPYLAAFALTHPDADHCTGFPELLRRVTIGEIWFTPRIFREFKGDLCADAVAFQKEATRRVRKTIDENGRVESGHRCRLIGYDHILRDEEYAGFPDDLRTVPGMSISWIDNIDCNQSFEAFVHAPFKDDAAGERNDTSLGLRVALRCGGATGRALLLGDLCYPTITRIFERSKPDAVAWNILLAPHHCSKSVMYWPREGETEESLREDVLDAIERAGEEPTYVVASTGPIPSSNKPGDNPPHALAKARYQERATTFTCTGEHPSTQASEPIVFELSETGLRYVPPTGGVPDGGTSSKIGAMAASVAKARGSGRPPGERVGFGRAE